ncbi:dTDP-4-dehydrorhamnose reductase [Desulforudis sp. 1088]|uniref:dTDP-4-dehydrorhamnose reductase n=1 Tax=unclassified Candidatus Desulforudis TaxID=2635950 RepID=UPI003CE493AA
MHVLVTGAHGMLGRAVAAEAEARGWVLVPLGRTDLDITDLTAVRSTLREHRPEVVVNCAAYTDVDGAEEHRERAFLVNGLGPRNLALACREMNAELLHVSTDYIFDGRKDGPYGVYDDPCPVNVYGASKLWGERAVTSLTARFYIVRVSWLFAPWGKNFVATMLRLGRERERLRVVDDQYGCPTYAPDLARLLLDLIATRCYGVYHATNQGVTIWCGFARAIMKQAGLPARVEPCTSADFPRPARRPANSVLDPFPLRETVGYLLPYWEDALERCLKEMRKEGLL